jgi:hypothetical protein
MSNLMFAGEQIARAQVADRERSIPYRPEYNAITGDVKASILLQQIWYWWQTNGRRKFYKYKEPCEADRYKDGDSWVEELGFTRYEFDSAMDTIGTKITKGVSKSEARNHAIVLYWTDSNRMTWYEVNEPVFFSLVGLAYNEPAGIEIYRDYLLGKVEKAKVEKSLYLESGESRFTLLQRLLRDYNIYDPDGSRILSPGEAKTGSDLKPNVSSATGEVESETTENHSSHNEYIPNVSQSAQNVSPQGPNVSENIVDVSPDDRNVSENDRNVSVRQRNFAILARICQINLELITSKQRGKLNQLEGMLRRIGATGDVIEQFGEWWYNEHWMGEDGSPPRPEQIRECWEQFKNRGEKKFAKSKIDYSPSPASVANKVFR